jgi:peptide deformylase
VEVVVKGMDPKGKPVRRKARGYLARVLQHEIDHTEGVLFIDRATEVWSVEEGEEEQEEARAAGGKPTRT